jgi:hypothetical protein
MSDEREGICAVCGRAVYRFGADAYQHLDWDDPDHNVVLADEDPAHSDGSPDA